MAQTLQRTVSSLQNPFCWFEFLSLKNRIRAPSSRKGDLGSRPPLIMGRMELLLRRQDFKFDERLMISEGERIVLDSLSARSWRDDANGVEIFFIDNEKVEWLLYL